MNPGLGPWALVLGQRGLPSRDLSSRQVFLLATSHRGKRQGSLKFDLTGNAVYISNYIYY
jgi:hypothetical protein